MPELAIPTLLYKFAKREHACAMVHSGIFRIGTLNDFRRVEVHLAGIGDADEGTKRIREFIAKKEETPQTQSWLSKRFLGLGEGVSVKLENVTLLLNERTDDCFMYCVSATRQEVCRSTPDYDSVVEISQPVEFGRVLGNSAGMQSYVLAPCNYTGRQEEIGKETKMPPEFLKEDALSYQQEWRFAFRCASGREISPFNVWAPDCRRFCRIVQIQHGS